MRQRFLAKLAPDVRVLVLEDDASDGAWSTWVVVRWRNVGQEVWSSRVSSTAQHLEQLLQRLSAECAAATGSGASAPGHVFVDGWDTWGGGTPEPLSSVTLDDYFDGKESPDWRPAVEF